MRRAGLMILLFLMVGCGGAQQIAPANRHVMHGLQTAVSSKKAEWLDASVKMIEEKHSGGEMADAEYDAFQKIVVKARAGDWAGAQKDAFALTEGQKPTAEDLERIKPGAEKK